MGGWGWANASSVKVRVQSIMWDRGHIYVSPFFPLTLSTDQRCVLRCVWRVGRSFPKGPSSQRPNKDERSKSNFTRVCGSDYIKKIIKKKTLKRVLFLLHQDRLGAVACLQLAVKHFKIQDHVVVIGGYCFFVVVVLFSPNIDTWLGILTVKSSSAAPQRHTFQRRLQSPTNHREVLWPPTPEWGQLLSTVVPVQRWRYFLLWEI